MSKYLTEVDEEFKQWKNSPPNIVQRGLDSLEAVRQISRNMIIHTYKYEIVRGVKHE